LEKTDMILDTNALSDLLEGSAALQAAMAGLGPLRLSPVVLGEHRYGLLRSSKRKEREATLRQMEATFETLPVTGLTSRIYARIRGELHAKGKPIPSNDLWIAAQAVEHGLPLVSRDEHFLVVKGLTVVSW
jgi:predicted nucleic acid-binding protein